MAENFPQIVDIRAIRIFIDDGFNTIVANYGEALEIAFLPVLRMLTIMEHFLQWLPWYVVVIVLSAVTYLASRSWKASVGVAVMMFLVGVIGIWDEAMATIALMLTSTFLAVLIGIPVGVAMSRSDTMQAITIPVLDIMQTMPIFVYLIPFVMLFGPGKIPALLATIVFAIPPVIRLTNLGIRQVDAEVIEAVTSFGATPRQRLFTAQIPLAMPTIMAGINQTTMMALSMVVIASMIGAGGLGYQVLQGIQRLEVSRGLLAGLGIVFLAVIFDRIAQAYGRRMQQHLHIGS
ncbi:MAG: ABC transporter permease subunit [Rhodobiaceae bacterium]|nr:ABC transporter permease subunit [Rhodobiaceae bacterium]MCC0014827.1 ABC transporter permease subunit [Rhodobiaceae bacterium]MCC0053167.1 ABC transporter permease subunit [Rhodobiaceae bacterium]